MTIKCDICGSETGVAIIHETGADKTKEHEARDFVLRRTDKRIEFFAKLCNEHINELNQSMRIKKSKNRK